MMTQAETYAVKAKTLVPMSGEKVARGKALFGRLETIDNGLVLVHNGRIVARGKAHSISLPPGCACHDAGDVCLAPGVINCHAHLDLSHLAGKTTWGCGFSSWLTSLIKEKPRQSGITPEAVAAGRTVCESLHSAGTACVGSICPPKKESVIPLERSARENGLGIHHFCEGFGFLPNDRSIQETVRDVIQLDPGISDRISAAAHTLYSTDASLVQTACRFSAVRHLPFSLHLAESADELEMLLDGKGPLYDIFQKTVLPSSWTPPRMRPVAYAIRINIVQKHLLAVHCVHVDRQEAEILALHGISVCLCPRSNKNLAVGSAPLDILIAAGLPLCLGTDGLSSNTDVNVVNEALFLQETQDMPKEALLRMLTVNGAGALNRASDYGHLDPGYVGAFCVLPESLAF